MQDFQRISGSSLQDLMHRALRLKIEHRGLKMGLCTISNARSGACTEDCAFCAQSQSANADAPVYPLKSLDILLREAELARQSGAERFSLVTSGRGPSSSLVEDLAEIIFQISKRVDIGLCCSLGIIGRKGLTVLKEAGLSRYHHNLEACREFFPSICTTHTFDARMATIKAARKCGLQVCAGGIIGLGESLEHRFFMAKELADLKVDSVPLNILVPIRGTRLQDLSPVTIPEIIRTVAMFRIMLPSAAIRLAGGRESALGEGQILAFMAGADAMLIGGYLTTRGRPPETDIVMTKEIRQLWKEMYHH